jgi:hypothetical protein
VSTNPAPQAALPYGTLALLAAAGALYVAMLANTSFSSGGPGAMSDALASLFFTIALFVALAVLLAAGGIMGAMPRWSAIAAVFLVPLSGVATFVAIDMCSRHIKWAIVFPIVLPLVIALYALWARMPRLRAAIDIRQMSVAAWSAVFVLSVAALLAASIV